MCLGYTYPTIYPPDIPWWLCVHHNYLYTRHGICSARYKYNKYYNK